MCVCVHVCVCECCGGDALASSAVFFSSQLFCTANSDKACTQEYHYHTHTHIPHAHAHAHAQTVIVLPVVVGLASEDPFGHVAQRIRVVIYSEPLVS